jgi:hypothetical protein
MTDSSKEVSKKYEMHKSRLIQMKINGKKDSMSFTEMSKKLSTYK